MGGRQRARARHSVLRAGDAAVPQRRAAHRATSRTTRSATRSRTSTAAPAGGCCTRWATTRSGCPPRTTRSRPGQHPRDSTNASIAQFQRQFRDVGHLDRLVARVRHPRAALLPLDAVDLPAALRARPGLPQGGGGQVVPQRPDRAGQRAGRSTGAASAAATRSRSASSSSGSSASPTTPTGCSTTSTRSSGRSTSRRCSATGSGARRAPRSSFRCEELDVDYPVFTTRPDTLFGATFFVMAPEHPDVFRLAEGTEQEQAVHEYVNHALTERSEERGAADAPEDRACPLGRHVVNPVNGERIPMYVADYVLMEYGTGAIMAVPAHDERDFAFATDVRPADPARGLRPGRRRPARTSATARWSTPTPTSTGCTTARRCERIVVWLDREGKGHASVNYRLRDWLLSRQRYWGCPIPIVHCERCGIVPVPEDRPPGRAARRRGLRAARPLAAGRRRGLGQRRAARRAAAPARRETDTMDTFVDSSWYFLRYCDARQRRGGVGPRGRRRLDAGRPVHRRRRARDPAPDVRALLHEGARRPRPPRRPGAVRAALHAGDDHARRGEDVQVARERHLAADLRRALRRRHRARLHPVHRPARPGRRLVRRGRRGRAPLPQPAVAPERRGGGHAARRSGARRAQRAPTSRCCARRTGRSRRSPTTWPGASRSTRRSPPSWS